MRITKVIVKELFGNRSLKYEIELKTKPPITILHGPNGAGKTVIFKMLAGLFGSTGTHPLIFMHYPFALFQVEFDDGEHIKVTREYDAKKDKYLEPIVAHSKRHQRFPLSVDGSFLEQLPRSVRNRWVHDDISTSELMSLLSDEVVDYDFESPYIEKYMFGKRPRKNSNEPKWFKTLKSRLDVHFVSTDRLFVRRLDSDRHPTRHKPDNISTRTAVDENSRDLERRINGVIRNANTQENTLSSSFPSRVVSSVNAGNRDSWSFEVVQPKLELLKNERERLVEVGLMDPGKELQVDSYDDRDKTLGSVLRIYIEDSQKKYREYKELADKITLYKTMVEELMKDKELWVSKDKDEDRGGFKFINKKSKREIPLRELSSGEQHIIVLMYNLLFRGSRNADELILIDEPEISLHIAWQKQFVKNLERITELSPFDIMIATHSPHIVNARWDLEVPLVDMPERAQ